MYGIMFKQELLENKQQKYLFSFGGLMMQLQGHIEKFSNYIRNDTRIYLSIESIWRIMSCKPLQVLN